MSEINYNKIAEILGATVTEIDTPVFGGFSAHRTMVEHLRTIHDTHRRIRLSESDVRSIAQAFNEVHEGYEVDRLLVSPVLSETFQERCRRYGVRASPAVINKKLQGLRKKGPHGIELNPATKSAGLNADGVSYIAEIAYSQMSYHPDLSEDDVITIPEIGKEFELIARSVDPAANIMAVKWALISLRKARGSIKGKSEKLLRLQPSVIERRFEEAGNLAHLPLDKVPQVEGVFTIDEAAAEHRHLYVASSKNLRSAVAPFRNAKPFSGLHHPFWRPEPSLMTVRFTPIKRERSHATARDWYFRLVQAWQPMFNMPVELLRNKAA